MALIHGKKSDKEKKQKSKTSKQDDLQEVGDKKSSKSSSKKLKKSMPKKSMKNEIFGQQVPESSDNEVNNQNNFSVTSSKKQFKEDLEGKFDMIIEADEINEHESDGEPKGKNHDLQDDKQSKDEITVDDSKDISELKTKLATLEQHIESAR